MSIGALRARLEVLLDQVELPVPFHVERFCASLAARRRRPIHLRKVESIDARTPSGVWVALPSADLILFEANTTAYHQQPIILHEIGHMLCDHYAPRVVDDDVAQLLLPTLDVGLVRRVLARKDYSRVEEQEAETLATMVLERAGRPSAQDSGGPEGTLRQQLGSTFEE